MSLIVESIYNRKQISLFHIMNLPINVLRFVEVFCSRKNKLISPAEINLKLYESTQDITSISSISVPNGIDIIGCRYYWKTQVGHFVKINGQLRFRDPVQLWLNFKKNRCFWEIALSWWDNKVFIPSLEKGYFSKISTFSLVWSKVSGVEELE